MSLPGLSFSVSSLGLSLAFSLSRGLIFGLLFLFCLFFQLWLPFFFVDLFRFFGPFILQRRPFLFVIFVLSDLKGGKKRILAPLPNPAASTIIGIKPCHPGKNGFCQKHIGSSTERQPPPVAPYSFVLREKLLSKTGPKNRRFPLHALQKSGSNLSP